MRYRFHLRVILALTFVGFVVPSEAAESWNVQWGLEMPARKTAWEFTQRMGRDTGYPVAAGGGLAFVGCEHNGALLALDGRTGEERWRFYTGAPIRHSPVASDTHVYVGSDDGHLYCLNMKGELAWKLRGGPANRLVIGHERIMSAWPISTEPLLQDDVLYFVGGYWPVDGVHVHAVDAQTGKEIWVSSDTEFRPNRRMHLADGKLQIEGDNSRAYLNAATGEVLREKPEKSAPPERPELSGLKGSLASWSQAGDFLVAGTPEGVFGFSRNAKREARQVAAAAKTPASVDSKTDQMVDALLEKSKAGGYALLVGLQDAAFVQTLLEKSDLHLVVLVPDDNAASKLRRALDSHGLFDGHRLAVVSADAELPPYFASLIVAASDDAVTDAVWRLLHPYAGVVATNIDGNLKLTRGDGPPAGAADWTHEFRDAANTLASPDKLVKAPLGTLWYGGEAADARFYFDGNVDHQSGHGLNPQPVPAQVIDGRMILQGPGLLAAIDIYTGRILWETALPKMYTYGGGGGGLGIHSKKHPRPWEHEPAMEFDVTPTERCRASGFNCVSQSDGIYVAAAKQLLRFDPATGELISKWPVPIEGDLRWGNVRVVDDTLIATLFRPEDIAAAQAGYDGNGGDWAGDRMPMSHLIAIDRQSGKLNWQRAANWGFLNRSGICAGGAKVYCVDLITEKIHGKLAEAGRKFLTHHRRCTRSI